MHKKKLIFLIVFMLLITGCKKIDNNLDMIVDTIISSNKKMVNTVSTNYEFYLPIGVIQKSDSEYNQKFKIKDRYIYLYVDTTSYFYKNALNYKESENYDYYYKKLEHDGKTGYIGIKKQGDILFAEIVYNYSKIEFYADTDNLSEILANSLIIIRSIKYNDNLIKMRMNSGSNEQREVKYQLDSPKDTESKFSQFLQEYVPEEKEEIKLPDDNLGG